MALSVSQIQTTSYPAVLNASGKAENQFAESALLSEMKRQGMIVTEPFGTLIEHSLDYRRNPGAQFLASEGSTTSLTKTDILTAAQYTEGIISVPINWTKPDEAKNPSENQKIKLATALMENALASHDDLLEEALITTSTNGFLGFQTIVPDGGQGTVGGVDASVETWWRNYTATYASAGTNIQAQMTKAWNEASKGSGGASPTLIFSDGDSQAIYEGTLHPLVRFNSLDEGKIGFKVLAFKNARYVFSQYATTRITFVNPKKTKLRLAKGAARDLSETQEIPNMHAYTRKLFTMLQLTTGNKSRNAVLTQV